MGDALLGGLLTTGWAEPGEMAVVEALSARRAELTQLRPDVNILESPAATEAVVIAVKPAEVATAIQIAVAAGAKRILSVAAGVALAQLEAAAGSGIPVVRAMPNTPALVGVGASAMAGGTCATAADLDWAESILGAVGTVERVAESQLDAVTGLSGSGPAYVFLVVEALIEGGVLAGVPRDSAERLAVQTVLGAATLLDQSDKGAPALRAEVTSPGGTTAAGLRALESAGVRSAIIEAVMAATERSRELGASR